MNELKIVKIVYHSYLVKLLKVRILKVKKNEKKKEGTKKSISIINFRIPENLGATPERL